MRIESNTENGIRTFKSGTMKIYSTIIISILTANIFFACTPKTESTQEEHIEWKGMDDFHMVMAESFHPYRDSANLDPVKQYAGEMVTLVNSWINDELPAKVNNDEVKELLNDLKEEAEALVDLVEVGDDEAIGTTLTELHDTFHQLQEAWYEKAEEKK